MAHLVGWLVLLAAFAFLAFAFQQGQQVKPDPNKKQHDWTRDDWWGF
jgi:hypothetical protein